MTGKHHQAEKIEAVVVIASDTFPEWCADEQLHEGFPVGAFARNGRSSQNGNDCDRMHRGLIFRCAVQLIGAQVIHILVFTGILTLLFGRLEKKLGFFR